MDSQNYRVADPMEEILWNSTSSPVYISLDTSNIFPEWNQTVLLDSESLTTDSNQVLGQSVIYMDTSTPVDDQQCDFQGKISVMPTSASSRGLYCGECSSRLDSSMSFFQHWVQNHCHLQQQASPVTQSTQFVACPPDSSAATLTMERCNRCNHVFVDGSDRHQNHLKMCQSAAAPEASLETSQEISQSQPRESSRNIGSKMPRSRRSKSGISGNKYVCGVCNIGVKTVTSFFLHWLETHQGLRDILQEVWQCRGCSGAKLFPDSASLREHVSCDHPHSQSTDIQIVSCNFTGCPGCFTCETDLRVHLTRFHSTEGQAACLECPSTFTDHREAFQHFQSHHQEICGFCSIHVDKKSLRDHYLCQHRCEIIWSRDHNLQKVSRSPKVSQICTGASQAPVRLANGAVHRNPQVCFKRDSKAAMKNSSHSEGYSCSKCSQVFTNIKVLEKHFLSNHEFRCKFCSAVMDKDEYGQHLRKHLATERRKSTSTASSPSMDAASATVI